MQCMRTALKLSQVFILAVQAMKTTVVSVLGVALLTQLHPSTKPHLSSGIPYFQQQFLLYSIVLRVFLVLKLNNTYHGW